MVSTPSSRPAWSGFRRGLNTVLERWKVPVLSLSRWARRLGRSKSCTAGGRHREHSGSRGHRSGGATDHLLGVGGRGARHTRHPDDDPTDDGSPDKTHPNHDHFVGTSRRHTAEASSRRGRSIRTSRCDAVAGELGADGRRLRGRTRSRLPGRDRFLDTPLRGCTSARCSKPESTPSAFDDSTIRENRAGAAPLVAQRIPTQSVDEHAAHWLEAAALELVV